MNGKAVTSHVDGGLYQFCPRQAAVLLVKVLKAS